MRKIFLMFFLIFFTLPSIFAYEKPKIITREEWWADIDFMDKNSETWKKIYESWEKRDSLMTEDQKIAKEKAKEKTKKINEILVTRFWEKFKVSHTQKNFLWRELVWPIQFSDEIRGIVIHHTEWTYKNSYDGVRSIYKFHALNRGWWDIWYNFLIWENWEIFEWRAGWEKAVWAHALRNNIGTIWISVIWNYHKQEINPAQYEALDKLVKYLTEKYKIDLNATEPFFRNCNAKTCLEPIEVNYNFPLIWHRDAGITTCPWDKLYAQMHNVLNSIKNPNSVLNIPKNNFSTNNFSKKFVLNEQKKKEYFPIFEKVWEKKLLEVSVKIEEMLEKKYDEKIVEIKNYIIEYFKEKQNYQVSNKTEKNIKIKLSYPENMDYITISDWFVEKKVEKIDWKLFADGVEVQNFSIKNTINPYLEITSWDRTPAWHKEWIYKDNKFRWEIYVYLKENKLVVVNILPIEEYLKWLGEISDSENKQKAETILISARTYALWYVEKDRKFPWEFYDWSDDSDVFQKYLWYDLEQRSQNLNKIVESTKWVVLNYKWELIKPWYFSASTGQTMSFYEYCKNKWNTENFCQSEKEKYPFLQAKKDLGGRSKTASWHWVWLSGTWATYFSAKWWTSSMILKYFYEGIEIK